MDQVGDDFLAGATFAGDQNGDVGRGDAFDGAHDGLHGGALENGRGIAAHAFERVDEFTVLLRLLFALEGAFDQGVKAVVVGLGLKMKGAALGGLDGRVPVKRALSATPSAASSTS